MGEFEKMRAVAYQSALSRSGEYARAFLGQWQGKLACDDFAGYKASFDGGVTEIGCMAHSRCKFFGLHDKHKSGLAGQALCYIVNLHEIEAQVWDVEPDQRLAARQQRAGSILERLYAWLEEQRRRIPDGSVIARTINYNLKRWPALIRHFDDSTVPTDNNHVERQIRPAALGRSNWLFAGSLRTDQRTAAVTSLTQSARLNEHNPYAYLKDVLTRLPTHKAANIAELLLHRWTPSATQLARRVHRVFTNAEGVTAVSPQIAAGNLDLSSRTEEQTASSEEAAANIGKLTPTVRRSSESAVQASLLVGHASDTAVRGGKVMNEVVQIMQGISESSAKVGEIIGVIGGIAFQTDIPALNVAVEAARAGEQGRGFAVVAGKVCMLVQCSVSAAKEIKGLISQSAERVEAGARLVYEAGTIIDDIVTSVHRVTQIVGEISAASAE